MKSGLVSSVFLLVVSLCACSSTQENRQPSSERTVSAFAALNDGLYINCDKGSVRADTKYIVLNKDQTGDYILKYRAYGDSKPWTSSSACKEHDNGMTCFAKDGTIFRIDYVFTQKIYGETLFKNVKFGTDDSYTCTTWESEKYRSRLM